MLYMTTTGYNTFTYNNNPVINSSFLLNGNNRFQERDGYFYNYIQPYYYFTNSPPDGVNTYTFSLNPNDTQPSGTINLGYINSKDLLLEHINKCEKDIYFADDTHWSPISSLIIAKEIYHKLK